MSTVNVTIQHNGATVNTLATTVETVNVSVGTATPSVTVVVNKNPQNISLRNNGTHIQWKYDSDTVWTDLASIESLAGKQVEFRKTSTHIEWRYTGDTSWTTLVALEDIKGEPGSSNLNFQKRLFKGNGVDDYLNLNGIHEALFCMVFVGQVPFDEADENDPLEPFQFKRPPNQILLGLVPESNERILVYYIEAS